MTGANERSRAGEFARVAAALLVSGLAYEMHIEAGITSHARKRLKAQVAARGGAEYAKFLLAKSFEAGSFEESDEEAESFRILAKNLERGIGVTGIEVCAGALRLIVKSSRRRFSGGGNRGRSACWR